MKQKFYIKLENVILKYSLNKDKTNSLKEFFVNVIHGRKFFNRAAEYFLGLNDISLDINEGEVVGFIGANGAGKSTLLKLMAKILVPESGIYKSSGAIYPLIELSAGFNPEFTGRENIYFNASMLGFTKNQIEEKEQEIIDFAEIEKFIDTPTKYYSSGMSVRLAFSIATTIVPEILLIDEMLAVGDMYFKEKSEKRIQSLLSKARIIVIVSHDMEMIKKLCQKVHVMDKGAIIYSGNPSEAIEFYEELSMNLKSS